MLHQMGTATGASKMGLQRNRADSAQVRAAKVVSWAMLEMLPGCTCLGERETIPAFKK